jgi:hypothetical protein
VKPRSGVSKSKKRHVEVVTRLPTKRMATACWAFIVAKSTPPKTAPMLDFSSLQGTNKQIHQQLIHKSCGCAGDRRSPFDFTVQAASKADEDGFILYRPRNNPVRRRSM